MLLPPSLSSLHQAEAKFDTLLRAKHRAAGNAQHCFEYADQMFAFADALMASPALVAFCTDQASSSSMKRKMLDRLLKGKVDLPLVVELADLLDARWRTPNDLVTAVESLGLYCVISGLNADHRARKVEGELFQFATALKSEPEASNYLSNPNEPVAARRHLVQTLLTAKKADPATILLAERSTIYPTAGRFRATLNLIIGKIAASRDLTVAKVTSPTELTNQQLKRLQQLLTKKYGKEVEVNVSVDPGVLGGLRIEVGDRVLDDTYRARLYDAERRFANGTNFANGTSNANGAMGTESGTIERELTNA